MYLTRPALLFVAVATLSCSQLFAQDFQVSQLNQFGSGSGFANMAKQQPQLDSLPSDFFAHDEANASAVVQVEESSNTVGNALVLVGFATLLGAGLLITGMCVVRRKKHSRPSAPVNMFA